MYFHPPIKCVVVTGTIRDTVKSHDCQCLPHLNLCVGCCIIGVLSSVGRRVDVDTLVANVLADLGGRTLNYVFSLHSIWCEVFLGRIRAEGCRHSYPQFEGVPLLNGEGVRLGNNWNYVHTVVETFHELDVNRPQAMMKRERDGNLITGTKVEDKSQSLAQEITQSRLKNTIATYKRPLSPEN